MKHALIALSVAAMAACTAVPASRAQPGHHSMVSPGDLKWTDIASLPAGAKVTVLEGPLNEAVPITFRLKLPPNYRIPAHWHPGIEHVTVISGTFHMGTGDTLDQSRTMPLAAGAFAIMQPMARHFAWTREETVIQVHSIGPWAINYVNAADDPRKK